jgi:hypothetical protein
MDEQNPLDVVLGEQPVDEPEPSASAEAPPSAEATGDKPEDKLDRRELNGVLKATLSERDKRQAAEKERDELKARLAQLEAKREDAPQPSAEQRLEAELTRLKAEVRHGSDKVQDAYDWAVKRCDEDPLFNSRAHALIQQLGSPFEAAIALRKEADDLEALKNPPKPADPSPAADPSPPTPPRSLADAPNAGGRGAVAETPMGPGAAFAQTIRR